MHLSNAAYSPWFPLAGSIVISSCAQVALKHSANLRRPNSHILERIFSPWLLVWAFSFIVSTLLWIVALRELDLSYAYPLLGFGYVIVTGLAAWLLGERVSKLHWIAVFIIAIGAACVARSL